MHVTSYDDLNNLINKKKLLILKNSMNLVKH